MCPGIVDIQLGYFVTQIRNYWSDQFEGCWTIDWLIYFDVHMKQFMSLMDFETVPSLTVGNEKNK